MNSQQNFFSKNLELLKQYIPELVPSLNSNIPEYAEIKQCKDGSVTLQYKNKLIHSVVAPIKEAEKFVRSLKVYSGDCVLLYGFGLGYHVEALLSILGTNGKLLILEANHELLSLAFSARNLSAVIKNPCLKIITSTKENELASKLSAFLSYEWSLVPERKKKIAIHMPSFNAIPESFGQVKNAFELLLMERRYGVVLGDTGNNNLTQNRDIINRCEGVDKYFNKYNNKTGILVGAGPSLDANISYLKAVPDLSVIVCVDTSFSILMREGIKPDFVVTADPQRASMTHFAGLFDLEIPLVFIPTAYYGVVENYKGEKVVLFQNREQIENLADTTDTKNMTVGGGSVSCIALDFLINLGTNPVILVGQDCAYPEFRIHAKGSYENSPLLQQVNKYKTFDLACKAKIETKKIVHVKNKYGKNILTHQNLYSYLRYIESIINAHPDRSFFNLGSSGAKISGVKDINSLWEVCSEY